MSEAAPALQLFYFPGRGFAEPIRQILKLADVSFEDVRKTFEEWKEIKSGSPYGVMPYVVFSDGKTLSGSIVIARHLAELYGLASKDPFENSLLAAVADHLIDIRKIVFELRKAEDFGYNKEAKQKQYDEKIPEKLVILESKIKDGFMEGIKCEKAANWADIFTANIIQDLLNFDKEKVEKHANLIALCNKVNELPAIKKWLKERPVTEW
ncbi:glutathione S-transferase family protein [Salmonella sp. s51228]|uniref:glutathione S-transferase family protein n=1 Tax=Salmonella sp. s51228 TaxID=3159652 RepID=UPI003981282D